MVGEVPEIRRTERPGGGRGPVSLPHLARPDARHERRGRVPGVREEEPGQSPATGFRIRQEGRVGLAPHLRVPGGRAGPPGCRAQRSTTKAAWTSTATAPFTTIAARSLSFAFPYRASASLNSAIAAC